MDEHDFQTQVLFRRCKAYFQKQINNKQTNQKQLGQLFFLLKKKYMTLTHVIDTPTCSEQRGMRAASLPSSTSEPLSLCVDSGFRFHTCNLSYVNLGHSGPITRSRSRFARTGKNNHSKRWLFGKKIW